MSNIDKRAQKELYAKVEQQAHSLRGNPREYQVVTGLCPVNVIEMHAQKIQALLDELDAAERRIAELETDNAYIKNRHKELDLLIGKNILVMQAAIIEWQGTGDAKKGLAWIYNTLFGPGELPDESEKDAQAYFDRKYAHLDEELMNLHRWFWEQSEIERAAAAGKGE